MCSWVKFLAHQVQNSHSKCCTLKNKYDLTLCQSRLHTASETFICHKKKLCQVLSFSHP